MSERIEIYGDKYALSKDDTSLVYITDLGQVPRVGNNYKGQKVMKIKYFRVIDIPVNYMIYSELWEEGVNNYASLVRHIQMTADPFFNSDEVIALVFLKR